MMIIPELPGPVAASRFTRIAGLLLLTAGLHANLSLTAVAENPAPPAVLPPPPGVPPVPPAPAAPPAMKPAKPGLRQRPAVKLEESEELAGEPEDSPDWERRTERALARAREAMKEAGNKLQFNFNTGLERLDREIGGMVSRKGFGGASRPLVVPLADVDPRRLTEIEEDLTIMSRLLTKCLVKHSGDEGDQAMGIKLSTLERSRSPRQFYLEGQGALFVLRVGYPLRAQEKLEKEVHRAAKKPNAWEETRSELYGQPTERSRDVLILNDGEPVEEFDAERVEGLKKGLMEALKNATNMRHLASNDTITVMVQGPEPSLRARTITRTFDTLGNPPPEGARPGRKGGEKGTEKVVENVVGYVSLPGDRAAHPTTLLLRLKKADLDSWTAGSVDEEGFRKKVTVLTY